MARRFALTAFVVAVVAIGTAIADTQATIVTTGGQRHTGTLVYRHDNNMNLIIDGREQTFPQSEIAVIEFEGGNPSDRELRSLPASDNPPELERNMIVLRNGEMIHGKLYDIKEDGTVTIDTRSGGRRDLSIASIARLYMRGARARAVLAPEPPPAVATTGQPAAQPDQPAGSIRVPGNQPWTDTGIMVRRGDRVSFRTTGEISWAQGGDAKAGPDGNGSMTNPRYPVPNMAVGGLIGRVGNGQPFPIGSNGYPITMPNGGRLALGVNDDNHGDNGGAFFVVVTR